MIIIEDVMTREPFTLSRFSSLKDARALMNEKCIRHVPIVDEQNVLVGLVSQRDVLAHGQADAVKVGQEELLENESGTLLADVMTEQLVTIPPTANVRSAAQALFNYKFGCLPVVDEQQHLLGIVTDTDFVAITIQLLEMAEEVEPVADDHNVMVY
jgi:CBS domain-containing protein